MIQGNTPALPWRPNNATQRACPSSESKVQTLKGTSEPTMETTWCRPQSAVRQLYLLPAFFDAAFMPSSNVTLFREPLLNTCAGT